MARIYAQRKKSSKKDEKRSLPPQLSSEPSSHHRTPVQNTSDAIPLGTQVDRAEQFGHNLGQMTAFRPDTSLVGSKAPVQRQDGTDHAHSPDSLSHSSQPLVLQRVREFNANGYDDDGYNEHGYNADNEYDTAHDNLFHYDDATKTNWLGQVAPREVEAGAARITAAQVVNDPRLLNNFEGFMEGEFSVESVDFIRAVKAFKTKYQSLRASNPLKAALAAREVYEMYVKPGEADYEINIDWGDRKRLKVLFENDMSELADRDLHRIFDTAVTQIYSLITDSLTRYNVGDGLQQSMASASVGHGLSKNLGHMAMDQRTVRDDFVNHFQSPVGRGLASTAISTSIGQGIMSIAGMKRSWDNRKARNAAREQKSQTRERRRSLVMPETLKEEGRARR